MPRPLPHTGAGTLLKSERLSVTGLHGVAYRVMYLSESVTNKPVAGDRARRRPRPAAPTGGYPVVTWGHGTNGMADQCTPSLDPTSDVPLANDLLDQGWEVTASDYQGEGTPGILPYLVGVSAARNTIDIVRAAGAPGRRPRQRQLRGVGPFRRRADGDVRAQHRGRAMPRSCT